MNRTAAHSRRHLARLRKWKHVALLIAIVGMLAGHPLLVHWAPDAIVVANIVVAVVGFTVLLVVFEQRWERWLALLLVVPGLAGNFAYQSVPEWLQPATMISYHCSAVAFFSFAVIVVLQGVFRRKIIRNDDIVGAACGYLLAALAWSSLYALVHLLVPGSFNVPDEIASQLNDWYSRRTLFEYFSIVTLTGLGYGDITPTSPPAYVLVSLEVVFGLFYLAVVVAQIVGLIMVRSRDKDRSF